MPAASEPPVYIKAKIDITIGLEGRQVDKMSCEGRSQTGRQADGLADTSSTEISSYASISLVAARNLTDGEAAWCSARGEVVVCVSPNR